MSDFHYVRTTGPDGGVDAAEGSAIGLDLEAVLDGGLPPFAVAIQIIGAVAEILAIAAEDGVVHGDLDLGDVFIDDTGAVSVEGFGQTETMAPEGTPSGPPTDRYGLGMVAYALFSPRDLPDLPEGEEEHENAAIDAILALNLEGLPEEVISDIQWYLARLLAWEPSDRPAALEAWRAFDSMVEHVDGPEFVAWCNAALDGEGERRDEDEASRPMSRGPLNGLEDTTVTGGPLPAGAVNFQDGVADKGRSTAHWTRQAMKKALQKVMNSDYMEDPDTNWMPGTPIPPMDRHTGPKSAGYALPAPNPKRAPGQGARRRPPEDPISRPLPSDFDLVPDDTHPGKPPGRRASPRGGGAQHPAGFSPEDDARTEVGEMVVPTTKPPTPKPRPARKFSPPPKDSPTVPSPGMNKGTPVPSPPTRPKRGVSGPAPDPDTVPPQLVKRPPSPAREPAESESTQDALGAREPSPRGPGGPGPSPGAINPAAEAAPFDPAANRGSNAPVSAGMSQEPIPDFVQRGPDPFADHEEESGSNGLLIGGIAFVVVLSLVFCAGVGGVGGLAAIVGMPTSGGTTARTAPSPRPRIVRAEPAPDGSEALATNAPDPGGKRPVPRTTPASRPDPSPEPSGTTGPSSRPQPGPSPSGSPSLPSVLPEPAGSVRPGPRTSPSVRPSPAPFTPSPAPFTPSPAPFTPTAAPAPFTPSPAPMVRPGGPSTSGFPPSLPPMPMGDGTESILPYLVPEPVPNADGSGPSMLQTSMRAHLSTATAARNAVIRGDAAGAKAAAMGLEFINPPDALPPDWLPYVVDMQMEAWLMENSPDIAAAGFKVAQIGQACASCHAGVNAGPTVTPGSVPSRTFAEQDVMKRHAWAVDWMWVGLLANDQAAWGRGATELAESPFPSVILQDFPEQKFMDLEDKLHDLAIEGQAATNPDKRAVVFGKMLSTCARCHAVYREKK
ncbi:MAG: hypothetical protein R3F61_11440 [Myxococcota bacterium]